MKIAQSQRAYEIPVKMAHSFAKTEEAEQRISKNFPSNASGKNFSCSVLSLPIISLRVALENVYVTATSHRLHNGGDRPTLLVANTRL